MSHVAVKDLPDVVQRALKDVGYGRQSIDVQPAESVQLSIAGGAGTRGFAIVGNLDTAQYGVSWGSWGGQNMFTLTNPVDNDTRSHDLPPHGFAVSGSSGGGRPVWAHLYVGADFFGGKEIGGPADQLTDAELIALGCYVCLRSGPYRTQTMERRGVQSSTVDSLVERGYLSRNRAGATQVTVSGRNAFEPHKTRLKFY